MASIAEVLADVKAVRAELQKEGTSYQRYVAEWQKEVDPPAERPYTDLQIQAAKERGRAARERLSHDKKQRDDRLVDVIERAGQVTREAGRRASAEKTILTDEEWRSVPEARVRFIAIECERLKPNELWSRIDNLPSTDRAVQKLYVLHARDRVSREELTRLPEDKRVEELHFQAAIKQLAGRLEDPQVRELREEAEQLGAEASRYRKATDAFKEKSRELFQLSRVE